MADPMERILAIAVVQADENVALGNALVAAERMIADLRNQIVATSRAFGVRSPMWRGGTNIPSPR